jgi:hypothetical protein
LGKIFKERNSKHGSVYRHFSTFLHNERSLFVYPSKNSSQIFKISAAFFSALPRKGLKDFIAFGKSLRATKFRREQHTAHELLVERTSLRGQEPM